MLEKIPIKQNNVMLSLKKAHASLEKDAISHIKSINPSLPIKKSILGKNLVMYWHIIKLFNQENQLSVKVVIWGVG
jgi:hypothetical protein